MIGSEIDVDLLEEIKFTKANVVRLQGELNAMRTKMKANEKAMKNSIREKQDAIETSKTFETQWKDER